MLVFTTSKFGCHQEIAKWLGSLLALKRERESGLHRVLVLWMVILMICCIWVMFPSFSLWFCQVLWNIVELSPAIPVRRSDSVQFSTAEGLKRWVRPSRSSWKLLRPPAMICTLEDAAIYGDPLCHMRVVLLEETGNGSKHTKLEESVHHYSPINTH